MLESIDTIFEYMLKEELRHFSECHFDTWEAYSQLEYNGDLEEIDELIELKEYERFLQLCEWIDNHNKNKDLQSHIFYHVINLKHGSLYAILETPVFKEVDIEDIEEHEDDIDLWTEIQGSDGCFYFVRGYHVANHISYALNDGELRPYLELDEFPSRYCS